LALLISANGENRHLPPTGPILGLNAAEVYRERTIDVAPGDWLILATDGITDARDAQGAFFGTSGVVRSALSAIEAGVDDPAAGILGAAWVHGRGRFVDDASVLCVGFS
jgi:serine phosphatase RsbU (regulator of sigma subunit)